MNGPLDKKQQGDSRPSTAASVKDDSEQGEQVNCDWKELLSQYPDAPSYVQEAMSSLQRLHQAFCCGYCGKLYQDAAVVNVQPCQHAFCRECLVDAWEQVALLQNTQFQCRTCQTPVEGHLEDFERNPSLEQACASYKALRPLLQTAFVGSLQFSQHQQQEQQQQYQQHSSSSIRSPKKNETTAATVSSVNGAVGLCADKKEEEKEEADDSPSAAAAAAAAASVSGVATFSVASKATAPARISSANVCADKKQEAASDVAPTDPVASKTTVSATATATSTPASSFSGSNDEKFGNISGRKRRPIANPNKTSWDDYFERLVEFHRKHGHSRPKYNNDGDIEMKRFVDWVRNQRYLLARRLEEDGYDDLSPVYHERIDKLNSIGFDWSGGGCAGLAEGAGGLRQLQSSSNKAKQQQQQQQQQQQEVARATSGCSTAKFEDKWDRMYEQLVEFHKQHGHANIPRDNPDLKKLHDWVRNQKYLIGRKVRKIDRPLSPTTSLRVERLDALGFNWRGSYSWTADRALEPVNGPGRKPKLTKKEARKLGNNIAVGNAQLAAQLGKVLEGLGNLTALTNLGSSSSAAPPTTMTTTTTTTGTVVAAASAAAAGGTSLGNPRKRPAPDESENVAGPHGDGNSSKSPNKKRIKLERKLVMIRHQLKDAEQNVLRFQGVADDTMAQQAKSRMVDLYNKMVELEQGILNVEEEEEENIDKNNSGTSLAFHRRQRQRLQTRLELLTQQLAEAEQNVGRFQATGIADETMAIQAKTRMAQLYNHKVEAENQLVNILEDDDDDEGEEVLPTTSWV